MLSCHNEYDLLNKSLHQLSPMISDTVLQCADLYDQLPLAVRPIPMYIHRWLHCQPTLAHKETVKAMSTAKEQMLREAEMIGSKGYLRIHGGELRAHQ
jgi:hypothetical protein